MDTSTGGMMDEVQAPWRRVIQHDEITWNAFGRTAWVDFLGVAEQVRDLLEAEGYFYFDGERVGTSHYEFVFMIADEKERRRTIRPATMTVCYRLLREMMLTEEVIYRYSSDKPYTIFSAASYGTNKQNLELCRASRPGAEVKTRPHLEKIQSRSP
ncbi:MAG: hypothetical protein ABIS59_03105 [Candidatus Saccharibacteria bacterium]